MPWNTKNGRTFICKYCGDEFYRRASHIRRGITKSCGKSECKSAAMSGPNNPFWGQHHSEETKAELSKLQAPIRSRRGPRKGTFEHTPKAKAAISASLREQWVVNRDARFAAAQKARATQLAKRLNTEPRHRLAFTPMQKREWKQPQCAWCNATEDLVLDHVVPVVAGGANRRANAQTLCQRCNIWKATYVDRPFLMAILDARGASS